VAELGFVGLGVMGGGIAKRLLDAGHTVTGWNRTREKAQWLVEVGLRWADSPRAVADASEVTFTMVTNTDAVRAVTQGPDGILAGLRLRVLRIRASLPRRCRSSTRTCSTRRFPDPSARSSRESCRSWSAATPTCSRA
jgi:NAD binding domain of 6-phosphogluconate dehydrogenase